MRFRQASKFVNSTGTGRKLVGHVTGVPVGYRFECSYDMVVCALMTQLMVLLSLSAIWSLY